MTQINNGIYSGDSRVYPCALQPLIHLDVIKKLRTMSHSEKAEYLRAAVKVSFSNQDLYNNFIKECEKTPAGPVLKIKHLKRGRPVCPPRIVVSLTAHRLLHKDLIDKLEPLDDLKKQWHIKNRSEFIINSVRLVMKYPDLLMNNLSSKFVTIKQLSLDSLYRQQKTQAL